jgi:tetratricopeptide (TPR) repeat protein
MSGNSLEVAAHYILAGRHDRALETLAQLDGDTAESPRARELRGFALYGSERFGEARRVASDALHDDPDSTVLLYLLSLATEQLGELPESETAILAALEREPEDPELLCQYASVCMRAGQLDKAERLIEVASATDPRSADVLSARISLAYLRGDDRAARRQTEELLAMNPEDVQGHRMLGVLELNRGRMAAAAERLGEAVRYDPSHEHTAATARLVKQRSRPWWVPLNVIGRLGVVGSWVAAMGIIFGLRGLGFTTAALIATVIWLVICVISWIAPSE